MEAEFIDELNDKSQPKQIEKKRKSKEQIKQELLSAMETLSQKSPSNKQISECHQKLTNNMRHPQFLNLLFQLLLYYQTFNDSIAKLIVTQISYYIKKQISFGYDQRHDKVQINNEFTLFFFSKSSQKYKKMCEQIYMNFLYGTYNDNVKIKTVQEVQNLIITIISSDTNLLKQYSQYLKVTVKQRIFIPSNINFQKSSNFEDIQKNLLYCSHIIKSLLMGGSLDISHLKKIVNASFGIYLACLKVIIKGVILAVKQKNQLNFLIKTQLGETFMDFIYLLYTKADYSKCPSLKQTLLLTPQIYKILSIVFKLTLSYETLQYVQKMQKQEIQQAHLQKPFDQVIFQELASKQIQNKGVRHIISMKIKAIQILTNCQLLIKKKKKYEYNQYIYIVGYFKSFFGILGKVLCKEVSYYLIQYQESQKVKALNQNNSDLHAFSNNLDIMVFTNNLTKQLYKNSIFLLSELVKLQPLYSLVENSRDFIIFNLAFPLLISRAQHNQYSVEDYKYFRQEIINGQNMIHLQNSVSKLIEAYFDYIDGSIKKVMEVSTLMTSYYIQGNDQKYLPKMPSVLKQSWFSTFYSLDRQIQGLLTAFSIGSYLASSRTDIVCDLQKWINQHKVFLTQKNVSTKITISFLLMYAYYADNFYMNIIKGISESFKESRQLHRDMIRHFCMLIKQAKSEQNNQYKSKDWHLISLQSLDCLNNTFNQITLFPALYYQFPQKSQLQIPHTMGQYKNYPFYPIKYEQTLEYQQRIQLQKNIQNANGNKKQQEQEDTIKTILVHYRRLGINKDQYIYKDDMHLIIDFLLSNFTSSNNIQIIQMLTQFFLEYIKHELKNQGGLVNVPIVIREDFTTQVAIKIFSMYRSPVPNANLFWLKATQLLHILHVMAIDPYYLIHISLESIWLHPSFWTSQNDNLDGLLKCVDMVVRLAVKHYSSTKNIDIGLLLIQLSKSISSNLTVYIMNEHKYGTLFGIILNLIILKINSQDFMTSIFELLNNKLFIEEKQNKNIYNQEDRDSTEMLISRSFYLFLTNIYMNGQNMTFQDGIRILLFIGEYLSSYKNAMGIIVQTTEKLGKALVICLAVIEKQFQNMIKMSQQPNPYIKNDILEFIWKNVLYSSKIYKTILQKRLVSYYTLSILAKSIKIVPCPLSIQKIAEMYELATKCVFQISNKETLMDEDLQQQEQGSGSEGGEQEWWQNSPITFKNNILQDYLENGVDLLHKVTVLFLNINKQTKQWMVKLIQNQPIVIKNFLKHKIVPYNIDQGNDAPLRKIVKVKRFEDQKYQKQNINNKRQIKKQMVQLQRNSQDEFQVQNEGQNSDK